MFNNKFQIYLSEKRNSWQSPLGPLYSKKILAQTSTGSNKNAIIK